MPKSSRERRRSHHLTQGGFSLVGTLVAAAVSLTIVLALTTAIHDMSKTVSYVQDRQSAVDLKSIVTMDLSNPDACLKTIGGRVVHSKHAISSINPHTGKASVINGSKYDKLLINGITLENVNVPVAANSSGRMNLQVNISRSRQGGGPSFMKPIDIPIQVTTVGSPPRVASCRSIGDGLLGSDRSCQPRKPSSSCSTIWGTGCKQSKDPVDEGGTFVESRSATTNTDGYRQVYVCINSKWVLIESERLPSSK